MTRKAEDTRIGSKIERAEHKRLKLGADPGRRGLIPLLAILTAFEAMAIDMYLPAFPAVREEFASTPGAIQGTMTIFLIGLATGQACYGVLLDRYGRRAPMLFGLFLFVIGSVTAAWAANVDILYAGRLLQALGAAAGLVAPRAMVRDLYDEAHSARAYSVLVQVFMVAPILAPIVGGMLLSGLGWRSIFWVLAAVSAVALIWSGFRLPETLPVERRTPVAFASIRAAYGRLLADQTYLRYALVSAFAVGGLFAYITGAPFVLIRQFGLSPNHFSFVFASNALALLVGGQLNIRLLRSIGSRKILKRALFGHFLLTAGLVPAAGTGAGHIIAFLTLLWLAIGSLGLIFGNASAAAMAGASKEAGTASSLLGVIQYVLGAGVGILIGIVGTSALALACVLAICAFLACVACVAAERGGKLVTVGD